MLQVLSKRTGRRPEGFALLLGGALLMAGCAQSAKNVTDTPTFTPPGGTYTSSQTVTIGDTTPGAILYCTTDGSTPVQSSSPCAQPFTVSQSETVNVMAIAPGYTASAMATASFTINPQATPAATPIITPSSGTFTSIEQVVIRDTTPGAAIYYTTDGSAPTASSTRYSGAITLAQAGNVTVNAIAIVPGYTNSAVATASLTLNLPAAVAPTYSLSGGKATTGGTFTQVLTVSLADTTTGATIYYTIDGSTPTASSTPYTGPITVDKTETLQAIAVAYGFSSSPVGMASFTINLPQAATPVFSLTPGLYTTVQTLNISDATSGATLYYTVDGSDPTSSATRTTYGGSFTISQTETVKAAAIAYNFSYSAINSEQLTIHLPAPAPVIAPGTGTYTTLQTVSIGDSLSGATIYYTLDGSMPTTSSAVYSSPITVFKSQSLKAAAAGPNNSISPVTEADFTVNLSPAAAPVITPNPNGITYQPSQLPVSVTMTDATPSATIYYTLDGTDPDVSLSRRIYTAPISVSKTMTVNAIGSAPQYNYANSSVSTAAFSVNLPTLTAPSIQTTSTGGGHTVTVQDSSGVPETTATVAQTVTLIDNSGGNASIYYTTDGTPATSSSSTLYQGPITVSSAETIHAVAAKDGYNDSSQVSAGYTILTGSSLYGTVSSGATAITGATIELLSAGTQGYGSAGVPVTIQPSNVTTDSSGHFLLGYTCPQAPEDQVYLVSTGGSSGSGSDPSIALMTALGACSTINTSSTFTINEVTTVASAYALSPFASLNSSGGINVGAPASSISCTSSGKATCNYIGLKNAFLTVNNLVNVNTGAALSITPAYAANPVTYFNNSTVPQKRINTLADILASCVDSQAACSNLFIAATPSGGTAPADTLQSILNIAQHPGSNVSTLYGLVAATPPYTPLPSPGPADWTIALTFTGAGLGGYPSDNATKAVDAYSMDIDSAGNIYAVGHATSTIAASDMIVKFDNLGAPAILGATRIPATTYTGTYPSGTYSYGGVNIGIVPASVAVDAGGSIWVGVSSRLQEFSSDLSSSINNSGAKMAFTNNRGLAFDGTGDLWIANGTSSPSGPVLYELPVSSTTVKSYLPEGNSVSSTTFGGLTVDSNGNLWGIDPTLHKLLRLTTGSNVNSPPFSLTIAAAGTRVIMGADSSGLIYYCGAYLSTSVISASATTPLATYTGTASQPCGNALLVDGDGYLWSVYPGTTTAQGSLTKLLYSGGALTSLTPTPYTGTSSGEPNALFSSSTPYQTATLAGSQIDSSGNIWVLGSNSGGSNTTGLRGNMLVEFVGVAAPVVTPTSLAVKEGMIGVRP